jgi:hypothetical protein
MNQRTCRCLSHVPVQVSSQVSLVHLSAPPCSMAHSAHAWKFKVDLALLRREGNRVVRSPSHRSNWVCREAFQSHFQRGPTALRHQGLVRGTKLLSQPAELWQFQHRAEIAESRSVALSGTAASRLRIDVAIMKIWCWTSRFMCMLDAMMHRPQRRHPVMRQESPARSHPD